jgi:hypothetical protein
LVTFNRFKQKIEEGWVVTALPDDAEISLFFLGAIRAAEIINAISESEFIKEVADVIDELNGRPTTAARCRDALKVYEENPTEPNRALLRDAYEAIPKYNRRFVLGDQDAKDFPIRQIVYGNQQPNIDARKAVEPVRPGPKRPLSGSLTMSLGVLYRHSGIGQPLFPKETLEEVEALFRRDDEQAGVKRIAGDIREAYARHARRPFIVTRLAAALTSLADYLEETGRIEAAIDAHLESCGMNPDGMSPTGLARLAVKRGDAALARRLAEKMGEHGLEPIEDHTLSAAMGVDVAAFRKLLS